MSVQQVTEAELLARVERCMAGERLVVEHEGKRFSARVQHVGSTGVKVIPETALQGSHGAPGDMDGFMVSFGEIMEVEIGGVTYRWR
ncbi:hypothetical protein QLQ85_20205 [Halomonas sp. M4R5S39]|uniref:Toluene monooxygenase n=1 Tax=Halomonas kalidii TaxID=3043293 RepID=A0ABT6VJC9_9GAMM|nr:hypothetical protein [Halomonas kalidii]MDI5934070.1 hypothetical protein [Halomonas kalidii]MDI5987114.1 hypothetical protein [Halomonas kalidii]